MHKKYSDETKETLVKFEKLQEERAKTYRRFEQGNKSYLESGPEYDFITYRNVVNEVTIAFKQISEEIIKIQEELQGTGIKDVANIIATIQELEKQKLELTVEHHLARQMVADSNGQDLEKITEREIRQKLGEVVEDINNNLSELRYIVYEDFDDLSEEV